MHSTDLEKFHKKIEKHIRWISAFTQDNILYNIIKSCRLKPYSIFTHSFQSDMNFSKYWVDEFGNSLKFDGRHPYIVVNDVDICDKTQVSTDLFACNSINMVAKKSKSVMLIHCKFLDRDCKIASFYGEDEYIRAFIFNNQWIKISPLIIGINTLHEFLKNIDNMRMTEINIKMLDCAYRFDIVKCTVMPIKEIGTLFDTMKEIK